MFACGLVRAIVYGAHPTAPLVPPARIADLVRTQTPVCVVNLAQIILKIQAEFLREISKIPLAAWKRSPCKVSKIKIPLMASHKAAEALSQIPSWASRRALKILSKIYR
jgi:hypothetical protein